MSIGQIVTGTVNNLLNKEDELYHSRIKICHGCKLLQPGGLFGEICSRSLYLNPNTNEVSQTPKPGFKHGCGCILASKGRVKEAHCPVGKW